MLIGRVAVLVSATILFCSNISYSCLCTGPCTPAVATQSIRKCGRDGSTCRVGPGCSDALVYPTGRFACCLPADSVDDCACTGPCTPAVAAPSIRKCGRDGSTCRVGPGCSEGIAYLTVFFACCEQKNNQNEDPLQRERIKEAIEAAEEKLLAIAQASYEPARQSFASNSRSDVSKRLATPKSCLQVASSAVDGCRKGVQAQVANCKNKKRQEIDRCKQNQKDSIDRCKKRNPVTPVVCEIGRAGIPVCEADRINVPLCEVDRLSTGCCEAARGFALDVCESQGVKAVDQFIAHVSTTCSVATAVAKSAIKSYASGQTLGVIAEISELQGVTDTVIQVKEIQDQTQSLETTAQGIVLMAENNVEQGLQELSKGLSGIQSEALGEVQAIAGDVNEAVTMFESLSDVINGEINALTNAAIAYAIDIDVVKKGLEAVEELQEAYRDVQNTMTSFAALMEHAKECAIIAQPDLVSLAGRAPKSLEEVDVLAVKVEAEVKATGEKAGRCARVYDSMQRVMKGYYEG